MYMTLWELALFTFSLMAVIIKTIPVNVMKINHLKMGTEPTCETNILHRMGSGQWIYNKLILSHQI
jgi:hypothetical protein